MTEMEKIEREAVERVLAFANLGKVTDPEAVYALLEGPNLRARLALVREDGPPVPLYPRRLAETGKDAARILNRDLAKVEALLQDLANSRRKARAANGPRVAELLGKGALLGVPTFERGHVQVELRYLASGVESACGYGLALLYDAARPYGAALARCPLKYPDNDPRPPCEAWFLRLARADGGRSPKFCCNEHQRAADKIAAVERAREWRRVHKESSR